MAVQACPRFHSCTSPAKGTCSYLVAKLHAFDAAISGGDPADGIFPITMTILAAVPVTQLDTAHKMADIASLNIAATETGVRWIVGVPAALSQNSAP